MFSKKAGDPLSLFSNFGSVGSVKSRLAAFRSLFLKIDHMHTSEEQEYKSIFDDETESDGAYEYAKTQLYTLEYYSQAHRISTLIACYSILENSMVQMCDIYAAKRNFPIKVTDLRGEGIIRCQEYLEKHNLCDFSSPDLHAHWSKLKFLTKLRNCLAHCGGDITRSRVKIQPNAVNSTDGLFMKGNHIQVESKYVLSSIDAVEELFISISRQII